MTRRDADREGWAWSESYQATTKWLRSYDNLQMTFLCRKGHDAYTKKFMPHSEIDYSKLQPGAFYQGDHHECDFWVEHDGKQLRPWLTVWQDLRTRAIVGWHLGPVPHQDAILAALRRALSDWAIPERMRIDNGRDYTSQLVAGNTRSERDKLRRALGRDWQNILRPKALCR